MKTSHIATLSRIMKAAWTIFRKGGCNFSQALSRAWAWSRKALKAASYLYVGSIERETAKAVLFRTSGINELTGRESQVSIWLPNSAFIGPIRENAMNQVTAWGYEMAEEKASEKSFTI